MHALIAEVPASRIPALACVLSVNIGLFVFSVMYLNYIIYTFFLFGLTSLTQLNLNI